MEQFYAGLDVSDKSTHFCPVDEAGAIVWRGVCATDPKVLAMTRDRGTAATYLVAFEPIRIPERPRELVYVRQRLRRQ